MASNPDSAAPKLRWVRALLAAFVAEVALICIAIPIYATTAAPTPILNMVIPPASGLVFLFAGYWAALPIAPSRNAARRVVCRPRPGHELVRQRHERDRRIHPGLPGRARTQDYWRSNRRMTGFAQGLARLSRQDNLAQSRGYPPRGFTLLSEPKGILPRTRRARRMGGN